MATPFHSFTMDSGKQPGVSYADMPPELQQDATKLARQRAISEAMMGQVMQPIQQQTTPQGRVVPITGLQAVSKVVEGLLSRHMMNQGDAGSQALAGRYTSGLQGALEKYRQTSAGTPGQRDPQELEQSADQGTPLPMKVPGNKTQAIEDALMSGYGPMQHMATTAYADQLKKGDPYTLAPGASRVEDGAITVTAPAHPNQDKSIPANWKEHLPAGAKVGPTPGTYVASDGDTMQMKFEGGKLVDTHNVNPMPRVQVLSPPQMTVKSIVDPKNPARSIEVDARTFNEAKYLNGNNTGVIGESTKLNDVAKVNFKKQMANVGVGDAITKAREILTQTGASAGNEAPTASGLGSHVDTVGGFFGYTPKGAKAAAELKVVGGSLVSKVPRFEGPQSNFDLAHYKAVAGKIGDETVPIDIRLKALDRVEEIWGQFEAGKKNGFTQLQGPGGLPSQQTTKGNIRSQADAILGGGK